MEKIELEIVALSHSITQNNSYAIVLGELGGQRRMPIVIGAFEAQAIAVALEKMQPTRPLTHDLFFGMMGKFGIDLLEVIIYRLEEGIFYAKLVCLQNNSEIVEIDSRTSDALALAVRANCKIYTYNNILDSTSALLNSDERPKKRKLQAKEPEVFSNAKEEQTDDLKKMTAEELDVLLHKVLEQEDYVRAISIRDEINIRSKKS